MKKDLYVFLSYTSRESEVKLIQPLVDAYCYEFWLWANRNGFHIFYDHFSIPQGIQIPEDELRETLAYSIRRSHLMTAFLSEGYTESKWCCFEWAEAVCNNNLVHGIHWKPPSLENEWLRCEARWPKFDMCELSVTDISEAYNSLGSNQWSFSVHVREYAKEAVDDSIRIIKK